VKRSVLLCLSCLVALSLCPVGASAATTIGAFATSRTATQAGAPTDLTASFDLVQSGGAEIAKSATIATPAGFFLSPGATPRCGAASFGSFECPSSTQVGLITVRAEYGGDPSHLMGTAPVYALAAGDGELARLGFVIPTAKLAVAIPVTVRSASDYGLDFTLANLPSAVPLAGAELTLWGVPADPTHDAHRFPAGSAAEPAGCPGIAGTSCLAGPTTVSVEEAPLLHNPTTCQATFSSALHVGTYQSGNVLTASASTTGNTSCSQNAFSPTLLGGLTTAETRSPSGFTLDLQGTDEGFFSPTGIAQAQVRSISFAFPAGVEFDSGAAAELATCTDAQFAMDAEDPCPLDSEVGAFTMTVTGAEPELDGAAYLGVPEPDGDQPLFLSATGAGIDAKLTALLKPGSAGEPVTVSLSELPQLPLEELGLHLAAETGLLVTPVQCGDYLAKGTIAPWSSSSAPSFLTASNISLTSTGPGGGPCPGPATQAGVTLSPVTILADGSSTSLATATVSDDGEIPVPGDEIAFASTDPGQQIGVVTDNEDGTYTATITSSTTVGAATITATDGSVTPGVVGVTTLTQLAPETPPPPTLASAPPPIAPARPLPLTVTITKKPPPSTGDRTPTLRFSSSQPGSSFSCKIDGKPFRPCASPKTLPQLGFGSHTFSVRAMDPAGIASVPATYRFTVRRSRAS
jgi:hypothetical protein